MLLADSNHHGQGWLFFMGGAAGRTGAGGRPNRSDSPRVDDELRAQLLREQITCRSLAHAVQFALTRPSGVSADPCSPTASRRSSVGSVSMPTRPFRLSRRFALAVGYGRERAVGQAPSAGLHELVAGAAAGGGAAARRGVPRGAEGAGGAAGGRRAGLAVTIILMHPK